MANKLILERKKIDSRKTILRCDYRKIFKTCLKEIRDLNFMGKIIFWLVIFIYPLPYKLGRLFYNFKKDSL